MVHHGNRSTRRAVAAVSAAAALLVVMTGSSMAGNNGTLKVLDAGSPEGTPDNEPMVGCGFSVEAFGLDAGQTGSIIFSAQGGEGVDSAPLAFGPADADGYAIVRGVALVTGHYKATLYGKDGASDVKAKSKVLKVDCDNPGGGGGGGGGGGQG